MEKFNFNSTMVRLKVGMYVAAELCESNFNSTMVRLKDLFPSCSIILRHISIPLWYD